MKMAAMIAVATARRSHNMGDFAAASADATTGSAGAAPAPPRRSTKQAKKSSATFAAAPSTRRDPICASLPPTCAFTVYSICVPEPSAVRFTLASPRAKPAAPPWPSKLILYEAGATMSDRTMRPLNLAETGPTRAVIATLNSVSDTRSIDSQPGMQALSVSASFSAAQVFSTDAGTVRLLVNSMRGVSSACDLRLRGSAHALEPGSARHPTGGVRLRKCHCELLQALQIVHRQQLVDIGQHRANARRPRLEFFIAQQRIEPDQPPARLGQAFHFGSKTFPDVAVETITDQEHDRALREQPSRPAPVEFREAGADARATAPVRDRGAHARERDVDVTALEMARDIGEASAEQQRVHAVAVIRDRVQEEQQHARIPVHRSRDIAEHDQRRAAPPALPPPERDDRTAPPYPRAQGRAQSDRRYTAPRHRAAGQV